MTRQYAEKIITEYLKPIFGFTLKRCENLQDAEDLSQEIILRAFRALLIKDNIEDVGKFIWTIAHNSLSNYYRDSSKNIVGISLDEISKQIADPFSPIEIESDDTTQSLRRLQSEIAYLSKMQRKIIIAYYFENRKQAEIARSLEIPLGTVKWHLFEAKKELKRGMNMKRKTSELKFNPIKFHSYGINGSFGSKSPDEFFRSALSQNICYCVRNKAKSITEIADDLGVSPVYVESEVEFLEEYGFLLKQQNKYIVNFIISEPTTELLTMQNEMYRQAAELFANELYDTLISSGILDNPAIQCCQSDEPVTSVEEKRADHNFILWTLIPYITARSGEKLMDDSISFEEVATIRPDGAHNIFHTSVMPENIHLPENYVYMKNWNGPMWNGNDKYTFWQINSEWSDRNHLLDSHYQITSQRVLSLYERNLHETLSKDEYAWLAEQGYIKTNGKSDDNFKAEWQIVILKNKDIQTKLLAIGDKIKEKLQDTFETLKAPYKKAVLESVPTHLRKMKAYELQFLFQSDGWFLLHCITTLLKNEKLQIPTENQRKSLTTLISNANSDI